MLIQRKLPFVFLLLLLNSILVLGQQVPLDSLEQLISLEKDEIIKEKLLWKAVKIAYDTKPKLVTKYTQSLLLFDHIKKDSAKLISAIKHEALSDRKLGNYPKSIRKFKIVYHYSLKQNDSLIIAESADQIGTMLTFLGYMDKAQPYILSTYNIYKKLNLKKEIAMATNGLAIFYNDLGKNKKAVEKYKEALSIFQEVNDTLGQANVHANLGMSYLAERKFDQAEYHLKMQGKLDTLLDTQWGLGFHFDFMGSLKRKQGYLQEALKNYQKALKIRLQLDSHYNIAESRESLAQIYFDLKDYQKSIFHAKLMLKDKDLHHSLSQEENAYYHLSRSYESIGEYKKSLAYHKLYKAIADTIYNKTLLEEITEKDAIHEKVIQENKISYLGEQNKTNKKLLTFKNRMINSGAFFLIILLTLLFFLYRLNDALIINKKKLEHALRDKDILLREIHHRVKNNLQMISSLLTLQGRAIEDEVAIQAINDGRNRVRSMALIHQDLYNKESLTNIGVKNYLEKLCNELFSTYKIKEEQIELQLNIEDVDIDIDTLIPLGLIINELITNTLKHAFTDGNKGLLKIDFKNINDEYYLTVEDNGIGYDQDDQRADSFGTTMITALVDQLEGEFTTNSKNGTKTQLVFKI